MFSSFSSKATFGRGWPAGQISQTNLILHYDIWNKNSYPGSGASITDLKGNSNGSLANSPTYASNYLLLNGSNQALKTNTALGSQFSGTSPTKSEVTSVFLWVYPIAAGNILVERGTSVYTDLNWFDSNIEISAAGVFSLSTWHNALTSKVTSTARSFNAWYYVGWTYNGTTLAAYINGSSIGTTNFDRQAPYNNGYDLFYAIGASTATNMGTGAYCNMRFSEFHVYNSALSETDVFTNYNNRKSLYGL